MWVGNRWFTLSMKRENFRALDKFDPALDRFYLILGFPPLRYSSRVSCFAHLYVKMIR